MENFKVLENGQVLKRVNTTKGELWESYCNEEDFDMQKQKLKDSFIRPPKISQPTMQELKDLLLEILAEVKK